MSRARSPPPLAWAALGLVLGLFVASAPPALLPAIAMAALGSGRSGGRAARRGLWIGVMLGLGPAAPPSPPRDLAGLELPAVLDLEGEVLAASPPAPDGRRVLLAARPVAAAWRERPAWRIRLLVGPGHHFELLPGDRIRAAMHVARIAEPRNPGEPDAAARWARRGMWLRGWLPSTRGIEILESADGPRAAIARARLRAARTLDGALGECDAGLARALLLGDRGGLSDADRTLFRITGQAHLLAVSGLHVGLLLAGLLWGLGRLGMGFTSRHLVAALAVLVYVPLAGAPPSAVRAGTGAFLFFVGRVLGRRPGAAGLLGAVVVILLVSDPNSLQEPALALSLAAVLGILLLTARLQDALLGSRVTIRGVVAAPRAPLRRSLAVALAAWLATAPLIAAWTGRLALLGAPLSVLTVPLAALLLATGFPLLVVAGLPALGPLAAGAHTLVAGALRGLLGLVRDAGLGAARVDAPSVAWFAVYGVALLAIALGGRRASRGGGVTAAALLLALLWPTAPAPPLRPEVLLLDVGHGQAAVVRLPDGRTALLDAGSLSKRDGGARYVTGALRHLGIRRLDLGVVSHADADHAGAISAVHADVPLDRLCLPPAFPPDQLRSLAPPAPRRETVHAGKVLLGGDWGRLVVLAPGATPRADRSANDAALVLRLETAAGTRMLFPGDVQEHGVADLLGAHPALTTEVLVLPHHGRPGAGRDRLVRRSGASILLASCGARTEAALPPGTRSTVREGALRVVLADEGPRVEPARPRRWVRYDPPDVMACAPSLPTGPGLWIVPGALLVLAWITGRWSRWLTPAASAAAFVLGCAAFLSFEGPGLAALLATFLISTLLGRLPGAPVQRTRNVRQVISNGLPVLVGCAAAWLVSVPAGLGAFAAALACSGADTSATEIGTRYGGTPRRLVDGRPVPRGESGGVTGAGLLASVAGALLAPGTLAAFGVFDLEMVVRFAAVGVGAALLDSLLGATLQYRGRDTATGKIVERRRTEAGPTIPVSGIPLLDNSGVNLATGLAAALAGLALGGWTFGG